MWGRWEKLLDTEHTGFLRDVNDKSNPSYQYLSYTHVGGNEENVGIKNYHLWLARNLSKKGLIFFPMFKMKLSFCLGNIRFKVKSITHIRTIYIRFRLIFPTILRMGIIHPRQTGIL
jgi:hypothetical protein